MKSFRILLAVVAMGAVANGCGGDSSANPHSEKSEFEILCTTAGGIHENGRCKCDDAYCDEGDVCNAVTKKCPEKDLPESCSEGAATCANGMAYRCNADGRFVEDKTCDSGCLPDRSGCAECVSDSCKEGYLAKCEGGRYQGAVLCESSACASATACDKECDEGDRICRNGRTQVCVDEHYKEDQVCEYGCAKDGGDSCASGCDEGAKICTDGQVRTCVGGRYGSPVACENHNSCRGETECGACVNGEVYCVDDEASKVGYLRTCRDGQLDTGFKCNDDHSCDSGRNTCGVCRNGLRRCVNDDATHVGRVEICVNGQFVEEKACDGGFSCRNDTTCGECVNDTQTCTDDAYGLGTEHACVNGALIHKACDQGNSCNLACHSGYTGGCDQNKCGQCRNGYKKCGDNLATVNMLISCEQGELRTEQCTNIDSSTPYCLAGQDECSASQP